MNSEDLHVGGRVIMSEEKHSKMVSASPLGLLYGDVAEWQRATFKEPSLQGAAAHLAREAGEVEDDAKWLLHHIAQGRQDIIRREQTRMALHEELADVFHLLVQIAELSGCDLADAVQKKLAKNKKRTWKKPDAFGVVEHESEGK